MCEAESRPIAFGQSAVPAGEYHSPIDLNRELVPRPAYSYFLRVEGDGAGAFGLWDGDVVIVDRSVSIRPNRLVVAMRHGTFAIRQVVSHGDAVALALADGTIDTPLARAEVGDVVWGVITYSIHRHVPSASVDAS